MVFRHRGGKNEILSRRIGGNELAAMEVVAAMTDAQAEYFSQRHDGAPQYAQKFISDEGKQNGLYWKSPEGQPKSPLGPLAAYAAVTEGFTPEAKSSSRFTDTSIASSPNRVRLLAAARRTMS